MPKKSIQRTATNRLGSGLQPFDRPLNGKLITAEDPSLIGRTDFVTLKNLRYNDTGIEGVKGISSVATGAGGLPPFVYGIQTAGVKTGHHFHKDFPATEDHVLVQGLYAGTSDINILFDSDSAAAIPNADTYTALKTITNTAGTTSTMQITNAPNGNVVVCDGVSNYIWSGDEHIVGAVIASTADVTTSITNPTDYSDQMRNSSTDEVLTFSGVDTYTKLLYHFDGADGGTTITDSSGSGHTGTCAGNANTDTAFQKFGTASLDLDGSGDYISIADSADFAFGTDDFTIDFWVRFTSLPAVASDMTFYSQYAGGGADSVRFYVYHHAWGYQFGMKFRSGAVDKGEYLSVADASIVVNQWYHVAFVRNGSNGKIFIDGDNKVVAVLTSFSTNDVGNVASPIWIGINAGTSYPLNGHLDEFRVSKGIARWTADFTVPTSAYTSARVSMIIGSTRPLEGIKFYIQSANTISSALTISEWAGTSWSALSTTDHTNVGPITLSVTGSFEWASTVSTSKPRYFAGYYLYWYKISLSAGEATFYMITTKPSFQEYKDSWDGELRPCLSLLNVNLADFTIQTLSIDMGIFGTDTDTYVNLGLFDSSNCLYMGFLEKITALKISMPSSYVNIVAGVTTISYWNGVDWVAVTDLNDGTAVGGAAFARSGVISWKYDSSANSESKITLAGTTPFYYYKLTNSVATTFTANTSVDCIQGIPAPTNILPFKIPVMWQDRLWLLNEINGRKNLALGSAVDLPESMNGFDSVELEIGDSTEIVAVTTMYTRYGSNIYDNMVVCKKSATYLIDGFSPETFRKYTISDSVGCVAPNTMRRCDVNYDTGDQTISQKHICIWQAAHGMVMTDGSTTVTISDDIEQYFDPSSSDYINISMLSKFYGFYDKMKQEYHWLFCTGSSTSLTKELVYDIKKKKWFEMARSTYYLQCGFPVTDSYGFGYTYGGTTAGYLYRLENTVLWDATHITYNFKSSDTPLANSMLIESEVRKVKLIAKSKTSAEKVTITWYTDGATTGTALTTIDQTKATRRYYDAVRSFTAKGVTHQYDVTVTTNDGFDPLMVSGYYRPTRADIISQDD